VQPSSRQLTSRAKPATVRQRSYRADSRKSPAIAVRAGPLQPPGGTATIPCRVAASQLTRTRHGRRLAIARICGRRGGSGVRSCVRHIHRRFWSCPGHIRRQLRYHAIRQSKRRRRHALRRRCYRQDEPRNSKQRDGEPFSNSAHARVSLLKSQWIEMSGPVVSREAAGPAFGRSSALEDESALRGPVSRCLCRFRRCANSRRLGTSRIHVIDRIPQGFECER
jgi:hypothetical protein